jgi:hypothetical protein
MPERFANHSVTTHDEKNAITVVVTCQESSFSPLRLEPQTAISRRFHSRPPVTATSWTKTWGLFGSCHFSVLPIFANSWLAKKLAKDWVGQNFGKNCEENVW